MATPTTKRSYSVESPLGSPRTELATTAPASSSGRPALVSIAGGDTHGAASELEGDDEAGGRMSASALQASHEALPADIDVSWREGQHGDDSGAFASAKRFSSTVRLGSPGANDDANRASPRSSPPYYTTTPLSKNAAGTPTAVGTSGQSYPARATPERKEDDVRAKQSSTAAHLFASTFSTLGEGHQAARRSPPAPDGGASRNGGRSPMSARVDVLQNLLAPAEMGEQDLTRPRPNPSVVASACEAKRSTGDEASVAKTSMAPAPEEKVGGRGAVECGENVDNAERLSGRSSENGSRNNNAVSGFVDTIERRERTRPSGFSNGSVGRQQAGTTEHPQPPGTKGIDLGPTSTGARSGVDASTSDLDRGPERKAGTLGLTAELDTTAKIQSDGVKGLLRPSSYTARNEERWDERKAGPRPTIGERADELEELEVRMRQRNFTLDTLQPDIESQWVVVVGIVFACVKLVLLC